MSQDKQNNSPYHVVVVGGGFAGLQVARNLKQPGVVVTLIDKCNYHLFQPLLYQVATGALSAANIAQPLRELLRKHANVTVMLGQVTALDAQAQRITVEAPGTEIDDPITLSYDALVLATGARQTYFGNPQWAATAPGLKTLEEAVTLRCRMLECFEEAERHPIPEILDKYLNFVVVGGGATGVEMAGAIAEIARYSMRGRFRRIDPASSRIYVVEAAPRLLPNYPEKLSAAAAHDLAQLGITVLTNTTVTAMEPGRVTLRQGEENLRIDSHYIMWAAGVRASSLADVAAAATGAEQDRAGRLYVSSELTLPGHPNIYALGDLAHVRNADGSMVPGVAQAALQGGLYVARHIKAQRKGEQLAPFRYRNLGNMATIGRNRAVADLGFWQTSGLIAWALWAGVHLFALVDLQNKILVFVQWAFSYITHSRGARLMTALPEPQRVMQLAGISQPATPPPTAKAAAKAAP